MLAPDLPTITYALRGLAYFELRVFGPDHDLHSGLYGGVVHNPAQALCDAHRWNAQCSRPGAQKGESGPAEAQTAEGAMTLLGGKLKQLIPVHLPGVADDRYLILVDKVAATPPKFPRKPGVPVKQPL